MSTSESNMPDEEFPKINLEPQTLDNGDLAKELDILITNIRNSYSNEERFHRAQDTLFAFNVGLLCGLRQGRK